MLVRTSAGSAEFADELTTENGRLVIKGGTIEAHWPNAVTSKMRHGEMLYDIEIVSGGGEVTRILEGAFILRREITR